MAGDSLLPLQYLLNKLILVVEHLIFLCYILGMKSKVIIIDSEIMGGAPVFRGTRVPMQTLIDYLEAGHSMEDFLNGFPTVSRQQVIEFFEEAKETFLASV